MTQITLDSSEKPSSSEKIVRVVHFLSGDLWGGSEAQMLHQLSALARSDSHVSVLLFNSLDTHKRYREAGLECRVIDESSPNFWRRILEQTTELKPSILVAHGYKESFAAFLCSLKLNVPWISTFHGFTENLRGWKNAKAWTYSFLHRTISRYHAGATITVSKELAEKLGIAELTKTRVIYNVSPSTSMLKGSECKRPGLNIPEELTVDDNSKDKISIGTSSLTTPAILVVGRLVPVKRVDRALRVFDELSKRRKSNCLSLPQLYIVGDGPERINLESLASRLNYRENIHFLGFRNDASELIAKSQILLLTSDSEGIPTVMLEAISQAIPVVATSVGGIPEVKELIPLHPIILARPENESELVDGLETLLESKPDRSVQEKVLADFDLNFSPQVAAEKHLKLYKELLAIE